MRFWRQFAVSFWLAIGGLAVIIGLGVGVRELQRQLHWSRVETFVLVGFAVVGILIVAGLVTIGRQLGDIETTIKVGFRTLEERLGGIGATRAIHPGEEQETGGDDGQGT